MSELDYFNRPTSDVLKGIAILLLLAGHYSAFCLEGVQRSDKAGEISVVIFIFLSGVGLTKSYGLKKIASTYLVKRLKKVMIPLWITFALFFILDFSLLNRTYSIFEILSKFFGIIGKMPPNGAAWFVSYIIYLYILFYAVSHINMPLYCKVIFLFVMCYLTNKSIACAPSFDKFFGGWRTYTFVFPLSVLIVLQEKQIAKILCRLEKVCPAIIFFIPIAILAIYFSVDRFKTGYLLMLISIVAYIISSNKFRSNFLSWLSSYSYEIYLLHLPLMTSYAFLGEKLPRSLRIILYIILLTAISLLLKKVCVVLNGLRFR